MQVPLSTAFRNILSLRPSRDHGILSPLFSSILLDFDLRPFITSKFYPAGRPHLTALHSGHGDRHLGAGVFLARPSTGPAAEQYASHFKVF